MQAGAELIATNVDVRILNPVMSQWE